MTKEKEFNNPQKVFKNKEGVEPPEKKVVGTRIDLTSIRTSEITSIVPDNINWNKIFAGKKKGLKSERS